MPTNSYDLIVLGDDFPGLVAATLCAHRGLRVLIHRQRDYALTYSLGQHRFPARPLPFIGLSSPPVQRVLGELHFDHLLKRKLRNHRPTFQLVSPHARVDVSADAVFLERELRRELHDPATAIAGCEEAARIACFLDPILDQDMAFPPAKFWERREVSRSAGRLADQAQGWSAKVDTDPLARTFIALPAVLGSRLNPPSPEARARCFQSWRQGTPRLAGDWATLSEVFQQKFTSHSGEIRGGLAGELIFKWGRVTGVRLDSGEELGAEHIIAALPLSDLMLLAQKKSPKRLAHCANQIRPAGYRYTLNLLVAQAGIPPGMAATALVVGDCSAPLVADNALAIYIGEPDDNGHVVVTVEVVTPFPRPGQRLQDLFAAVRLRIRERLESVMPFLSNHVLLVHSPHELTPAEGSEDMLALPAPIPAQPVWHSALESYLGLSAVPYRVGIKRLTVASSQVLPGLGLEGDFIAGWCAARMATAAAGKRPSHLKNDLFARRHR